MNCARAGCRSYVHVASMLHRNIAVLVLRSDLWLWLQAHSEKAEHSKARQEDARSGDWGRRCSQTVRSLRHFFQSASAKATHPAQRRCSLSILTHPSLTLQGSRAWSPLRDGCEMPRITWHQRDSIWPPGEPQPGSDQRRGTTLFRTLKVNIGVELQKRLLCSGPLPRIEILHGEVASLVEVALEPGQVLDFGLGT